MKMTKHSKVDLQKNNRIKNQLSQQLSKSLQSPVFYLSKPGRTELLVFMSYLALVAIVMYFHEPWFDEAQAWLIARDASFSEIFRTITHYEGHPPIWFLLLMPFAKLGVPFEFGIKSLNLLLAGSAVGLIVFKAPFSRLFRYLIPFTYFFFYQYGVISRPYSLMMLGFVLSAWFYKARNERPVRFVLALGILCSASAYGIVFAGGIAMVWLGEIFGEWHGWRNRCNWQTWRVIVGYNRLTLATLFGLLTYALFMIFLIIPMPDTHAINMVQANSRLERLFYLLIMAPADATCTASYFDTSINITGGLGSLIGALFFGPFISISLIFVAGQFGKRQLLVVPYILFALFAGSVYFSTHHVGIIAQFFLFVAWCCFDDQKRQIEMPSIIQKLIRKESDRKLISRLGIFFVIILFGTSLYWTASTVSLDICENYGSGRTLAAFLKENRMTELNLAVGWLHGEDANGRRLVDYNFMNGTNELAYFDRNIYLNFNGGSEVSYLTHQVDRNGEETLRILRNTVPDIFIGSPDLEAVYGSRITYRDYALVMAIPVSTLWKGEDYRNNVLVFLRKDLMPRYPQLKELNLLDYTLRVIAK